MGNYEQHTATSETATDLQIQQAQKQIHTSLPAKVEQFNSGNQTVTLAIQIKQILSGGKSVMIPPLVDVPVCFPRGGGFAVTFPLNKGDEGIAIFSERCIDGWWQSGNSNEPLDYRFHDLSDAMFVPGICSAPNAIKGFSTDSLSLQTLDGGTYIRVKNGKIEIKVDIAHKGNQTTTGTVTGQTDVIAAGISGKGHTHSGVKGGSDTSGKPQ